VQTGNTSISNLTAIPSKSLFKSRTWKDFEGW
jgi:hypothetical protein